MIIVSLDVRIVNVFVFTAIWVRLYNTLFRALCNFFSGNKVTAPSSPKVPERLCSYFSLFTNWYGFENCNPFSWIFNAISSEKSCLISMPFLLTYIDARTVKFFPPAESWLVNSNFRHASHMQGNNSRNTRGANWITLPARYNWVKEGGRTFSSRTLKCWNHFPLKIRTSQSVNIFKNLLYKHFRLSQLRDRIFIPFLDNYF